MVIPLRTFSLLRNRSGVVPDVFIVDRTVREWTMDWSGLLILRFLLVSFYHLEGIQDLQDKEEVIHQKHLPQVCGGVQFPKGTEDLGHLQGYFFFSIEYLSLVRFPVLLMLRPFWMLLGLSQNREIISVEVLILDARSQTETWLLRRIVAQKCLN